MTDSITRPIDPRSRLRYGKFANISRYLILVYIILAIAAILCTPFLATKWMRLPFIGGFVENTMVINGYDSSEVPSTWPAKNLGFGNGYQLISVDGQPVSGIADLENILAKHQLMDEVSISAANPYGSQLSKNINLIKFPAADRITYFYFPFAIGLIYLGSAIWIYTFRRHASDGKVFTIFAVSVGICSAGLFDLFTTHVFSWLWSIALALATGAVFSFAFVFPSEDPVLKKKPALRWLGYALALLVGVLACFWLYNRTSPFIYKTLWGVQFGLLGAAIIFTLGWIGFRRYRRASQLEGRQIRMVLIAIGISTLPLAIWLVVSALAKSQTSFTPFLLLPLGVFPILFAYTIQRFRLLSADYILSRVMIYTILAFLVVVGYALIVSGLGLLFSGYLAANNPVITGLAIFGIALLFIPVRQSMLTAVDQLFFRGNKAYQERLNSLSEAIKDAIDMKSIVKIIREHIHDTIAPVQMHVYVFDTMNEQFTATQDESGKPSSDIRFSSSSALASVLASSRNPVYLTSGENLPENLKTDSTRLKLLGANLIIPLIGSKRLAGWLAFGPRKSGEEYSLKDLSFLDKLASQATMAIERAQVLENMENRVRAMNVLARVAQGVNVTITMDDLFELIYAQTIQIVAADDFQLSLINAMTGKLVQEFYVEKDERLTEKDGFPLVGAVLEEEVARQRKAIVTTDYVQECQRRGVLSARAGVYAWVCVPLNTGSETVGVLSLANRKVSEIYTREEVDLLQSIGDQVAGAIVKARLLQESEKRARQLATLNEVTRQLTSTLDVEPLLQTILQKATDILFCEAGSLLTEDEETGNYVFRATVGPVAEDLLNRHLPAGSGMVGKAFTTQMPIIVNNVMDDPDWNAKPDRFTGFVTRALLVVPMIVKEKVIGVLEVLNKKDGSPFGNEDQNLLMAFAAQAAVAFDNARLYTTTDQALEARVEELSVMQRIDRELNISLDTARAMQITLAWAMDQSGATAGFVGPVNDGVVKIQASTGFPEPTAGIENGVFQIEGYNHLIGSLESGEPTRLLLSKNDLHLLPLGKYQIVLPIRRESSTIGLVYLESEKTDPISDEKFEFLQRLCDHAAVAIANAQLFNAVQAANLAKSEFVSFVAHELKNPMTSIKGYTELLAAGAVGQINEAQSSFLVTIRSNIDRMNTLISDLNDLSKIEAGRLKLEYRAVLLPELVEETIRSTRKQVEDKGQQLVINLPDGLPAVWADRTRLVQVLVNLVSNAHKYTEQGGKVFIGAEPADNQWDPQGPKKIMHLWVQDTGIGINPEDQKKIFQKFFRSEDPKTREVPGTGLGLNITKSLVEMQGGKIWFESEFRKGTTFHITVPLSE